MGFFKKLTKGFNFLTGMPKKGTALGKLNNIATGGLSNAMQSRGGQRLLTGGVSDALRSNSGRQAMGSMGAQMLGMDPALGAGVAQGMQRLQQGREFDQAIEPIERMQMDPQQFMKPAVEPQPVQPQQFNPMQKMPGLSPQPEQFNPMQKPGMGGPQLGVIRPEMGAPQQVQPQFGTQPQGGGSWRDPRMQKLFGRQQPGPRY